MARLAVWREAEGGGESLNYFDYPMQGGYPMNMNEPRKTCGAKRRDGLPCRMWILCPNGRCRMHGGMSPYGLFSPRVKHGAYSRDMTLRIVHDKAAAQVRHLRRVMAKAPSRGIDPARFEQQLADALKYQAALRHNH